MNPNYARKHKIKNFKAGDFVSVLIPKAYHHSLAKKRLICKVIKKTDYKPSQRFQLSTEYGILEKYFAGKDLAQCSEWSLKTNGPD